MPNREEWTVRLLSGTLRVVRHHRKVNRGSALARLDYRDVITLDGTPVTTPEAVQLIEQELSRRES